MAYDTFEEELDAIRLAIYEEIKNMTPEEEVAYIKAQAAPIIKEYGLRTVNQIEGDEHVEKGAVLVHR